MSPTSISLTRFMLEEKRAGGTDADVHRILTRGGQRMPVFIGSQREVEHAVRCHLAHDAPRAVARA